LIDSVALVINYAGNQLASEVTCSGTSPALKSKSKSLTFTELLNWHSNQKIICLKLDIKNE
jgi:hypothetical protein